MKNFYFILFFMLIAGNILIYKEIFAPHALEVSILEVGKGNSVLIRTPHRKTLLIDAGPDASILRALGTTLPEWQRSINAIVLTSTKANFVGGLPEIMSHYRVPTPIRFGNVVPYGTRLALDDVHIEIISPATLAISYGATSLSISSTTPLGIFISDGKTITKTTQ